MRTENRNGANGAKKLLVVEDDARIADFLVRGLSSDGIEVTLAEDGEVARFLAATESFDAVVLDLGLPLVSGEDVFRFLRAERPGTPVIVLTARDEPESRQAVVDAGAVEYVTKPFAFEDLRARVEACFETPQGQIWLLTDRRYARQRMPRALLAWLTDHGYRTRVVVADDGSQLSTLAADPGMSVWARLDPGDVVVVRSRHPFALALLKEAEALGARTVGSWDAVQRVRNKVRAVLLLREHGLPTPETFLVHRPADLVRVPRTRFPLVLKPFQGDNAEGIRLINSPEDLPFVEWSEAMVLAQPFVDAGGVDVKLYVAGSHVWAVRRHSPLTNGSRRPVRVPVDASLGELAETCVDVFELPLLGIDVLEGADGPLIVDVNEFPNYTGIDEAPAAIGRLLLNGVGESRGSTNAPHTRVASCAL
jgi:ribosomal protein S6--L-glutamate ligase